MSINRVEISGRIGRDPKLLATASGTQVCTFSVCVNDRRKSGDKWEDVPNWVEVVFYGNRAESINKYLSKGSLVFVAGRLRQSHWETKDGQKRSKLDVVGEDIQFGDGNREQRPQEAEEPPADPYDDEIPF